MAETHWTKNLGHWHWDLPEYAGWQPGLPVLGHIKPLLDAAKETVSHNTGFALISGVDLNGVPVDACKEWLIDLGKRLGTVVPQSPKGAQLKEVKSEAGSEGEEMAFHADRCDVVILLYVRSGVSGGKLRLANVPAVYHWVSENSPDLAKVLLQDFPQDKRGEFAGHEDPWMMAPIMAKEDGILLGRYNRRFIESTQRFGGAPRLTADQIAALDMLDKALGCPHLVFELQPKQGDLLFINNHVTWHARTAYSDGPSEKSQRLALRLWISHKDSPRLPASFAPVFGSIEPGSVRGGVPQRA